LTVDHGIVGQYQYSITQYQYQYQCEKCSITDKYNIISCSKRSELRRQAKAMFRNRTKVRKDRDMVDMDRSGERLMVRGRVPLPHLSSLHRASASLLWT
jgi:hypothetical protein